MTEWTREQAKAETVATHAWGLDSAHWAASKRATLRGVRQRVTLRRESAPRPTGDRIWRISDADVSDVSEPCS